MAADVIKLSLGELPAALRRVEERVRAAIRRGAQMGAHAGRALMVRKTPTDLGQLKASWRVLEMPGKDLEIGESTLAELRNDAPHAALVELGTRPHKVSPAAWQALYEWVRRHAELYTPDGQKPRIRPQPRDSRGRFGGKGDQFGGLGLWKGPDPEITAITNAIAFKIRKHGTKPTYFIRNNLPAVQRLVIREITFALARAADEIKRGA